MGAGEPDATYHASDDRVNLEGSRGYENPMYNDSKVRVADCKCTYCVTILSLRQNKL